MAFPTVPTGGRVVTGVQANTTATRTFPSLSGLTKNSGDLLIAIVVGYQSSLTSNIFGSWGGGFTEIRDIGVASQMCLGVAYKISDGTETGTFTVTQAGTVTGHAAFILLSIPGAHGTTAPEVSAALATGTTAAANPAALNPAGWDVEDTLWIAVGANGETSTSGTYTGMGLAAGPPTNYGDAVATGESGDVVGAVALAVAFRQLAAASEDVGTWSSIDLSNARNVAAVIAVRPAAAEDHSGTATMTGGGTLVVSGRMDASTSVVLTGGGVIALVPDAPRTAAVVLTGGGVLTTAADTARSLDAVLTGGGVATLVQQTDRSTVVVLTGGGALVVTGMQTEDHAGSAVLTGGGALLVTGEPGKGTAVVLTGGGAVLPLASSSRTSVHSLTGGGTVVVDGQSGRESFVLLTGGGALAVVHGTARGEALTLTGGGTLALAQATARSLAVQLTGGGQLVVVATGAGVTAEVVLTGGGSLVVAGLKGAEEFVMVTGGGLVVPAGATTRSGLAVVTGGGALSLLAALERAAQVSVTGGGSLAVAYSLLRQAMNAVGEIIDLPPEEIAEWFWSTRGLSSDIAVLTSAAHDSLVQGNRRRARRLADASELLAAHFPAVDDGEVNDQVQAVPNTLRLQRRN